MSNRAILSLVSLLSYVSLIEVNRAAPAQETKFLSVLGGRVVFSLSYHATCTLNTANVQVMKSCEIKAALSLQPPWQNLIMA